MEELLGFKITFWDYVTFAVLFLCVAVFLAFFVWIAGMPGRIAIARKHPDAEAVKIMGYAGFLPVYPWMQAFIWAFKPTDIIDIRRFPEAEAKGIDEEIARLSDEPKKKKKKRSTKDESTAGSDPDESPSDNSPDSKA